MVKDDVQLYECITRHPYVHQLLEPGPLEMAWDSFLHNHSGLLIYFGFADIFWSWCSDVRLCYCSICSMYLLYWPPSLFADDLFPNGEPVVNARNRLCAYRQMVFWCWPGIRRRERRPLPSCLVSMIRAKFPPTEDEEVFADFIWKDFSYGPDVEGKYLLRIGISLTFCPGITLVCCWAKQFSSSGDE